MPKRLARAEQVQPLGSLATLVAVVFLVRLFACQFAEQRLQVVTGSFACVRTRRGNRKREIVGILDDLRPHELVAVPGHRADEDRVARIVVERAT